MKDRWLKWMRTLAYLLMGSAGVFLLMSPVLTDVYTTLATIMSWFLVVGGASSFWGALTERWVGEYVGLPLLASSFAVFGVISFAPSFDVYPYVALANLALLLSVSAGLMARWREARGTYRLAVHMSERSEP